MAPPVLPIHLSVAAVLFPPNPSIPSTPKPLSRKHHRRPDTSPGTAISRRAAAAAISFLGILPPLCRLDPAAAISIGISGPKDWLKQQKKKASKFLLAPIEASRESLRAASLFLTSGSGDLTKDLEEFRRLVRSASRDCVPQERNPFVAFQASTGVEVCTFQLILKNASSLLDNKDPTKMEAEAVLNDLIRSLAFLNAAANEVDIQNASSSGQKVVDALGDSISLLSKFEQRIEKCLEV